MANRRRLAILQYLKENKEASVGDIAEKIRLSFNATSKHLKVLYAADIVDREQRSLQMYYKLAYTQSLAAKHILSIL